MSVSLEQPTDLVPWDRTPGSGDAKTWSLLVVRDGESSTYPLDASGSVVLGRSKTAGVRVDHRSISREHARLHLGPKLLIEDLGSSNGTRLRGQPLTANVPVEVQPDEVIDLGAVLVVVQHRQLTQRLRRACSHAFFELRVEEECERITRDGGELALARIQVEGALPPDATQLVIGACLRPTDLIACYAPGAFEVLLIGASPTEAERVFAQAEAQLVARGARAQLTAFCCPRDGSDPERLLARRSVPRAPARVQPSQVVTAEDEAMLRVHRIIERIADSNLSVVLLGETGVGKEVCAELIHQTSPRAGKPFLRLNCAALSETLLESELFGYERGAFTGAVGEKPGLLESASGGTVLFDEIGDMPLATQVKLLRVLEAKEVLRLGGLKPRPIDLRVVAATHHELLELISAGRFREDLYYRLNGISIIVPPLRERRRDIAPLARHFIDRYARAGRPAPTLSLAGLALLESHSWPGNIRELRNLIERAVVLCDGASLEPAHLPIEARAASSTVVAAPASAANLRDEVKELERARIETALADAGGNQRATARALGLSRGALLRKLDQLGIARAKK
jgi:DNA-binding NtrC family response regulator